MQLMLRFFFFLIPAYLLCLIVHSCSSNAEWPKGAIELSAAPRTQSVCQCRAHVLTGYDETEYKRNGMRSTLKIKYY